jgi:hypothetical protein
VDACLLFLRQDECASFSTKNGNASVTVSHVMNGIDTDSSYHTVQYKGQVPFFDFFFLCLSTASPDSTPTHPHNKCAATRPGSKQWNIYTLERLYCLHVCRQFLLSNLSPPTPPTATIPQFVYGELTKIQLQ